MAVCEYQPQSDKIPREVPIVGELFDLFHHQYNADTSSRLLA
jgi:hypothetical protein